MRRRKVKINDILQDLRSGMDVQFLMTMQHMNARDFERLCRVLGERNLLPLIELMELRKLADSQEMRSMREIEACLDGDQ